MKTNLHPRNKHKDLYDFKQLIKCCPDLAQFVKINPYGNESIDFANPRAVKTLNKALLKSFYNITWDIPDSFLCPPIPSRADYIHTIADLLSQSNKGIIPLGINVSVLDIGVGANCIYPLIGHREYGWSFVGTDIDLEAIKIAEGLVAQNSLNEFIEIRHQKSPSRVFEGIVGENNFDICMCNPPFHASEKELEAGVKRKWKNLQKNTSHLNFSGQSNELFCHGGEVTFIKQMIKESVDVPCKWFTTLVSKESNLPAIYKALESVKALDVKTLSLGQGQKKSRVVAWTFSPKNHSK